MAERGTADRLRVVVLDDDPTGTQSAKGVTVLLDADADALAEALAEALSRDFSAYVQTNSRSLHEAEAVRQAEALKAVVEKVGSDADLDVRVVLRGDSTLRGHVFSESAVFVEEDAVLLFVPAFPEGGRVTRDGMHLVRQGGVDVPVGTTEFARDPVFSFVSSSLPDFVQERTGLAAEHVRLAEVRDGGVAAVLERARGGAVVVADAEDGDDVRLIADGVRRAWRRRPVVVRSAAPLAAELAGVAGGVDLSPSWLRSDDGALFVCGSHTDTAREQLGQLERLVGPATVIETSRALQDPEAEGERAALVERCLRRWGGIRLVATQRDRHAGHSSLEHGAAVMTALTTAAAVLAEDVAVVVTKGGITASDVIRQSLGATQGTVLGQVQPGVSVWDVQGERGHPTRCVIVPGNMGSRTVLADAAHWIVGADGAAAS